jgi:hypothetical protein
MEPEHLIGLIVAFIAMSIPMHAGSLYTYLLD